MSETGTIEKKIIETIQNLDDYRPKKYKVIILNDDVTPFDFVVLLLINVFGHNNENAFDITMKIHTEGSAVVGIYEYEIAFQKQTDALNLSRMFEYPLEIVLEEC